MKHVAYYNRTTYATNGSMVYLTPRQIIGSVEVPDGQTIWQTASSMWLDSNCPVADPAGYPTEAEAIAAGTADVNTYWSRGGK